MSQYNHTEFWAEILASLQDNTEFFNGKSPVVKHCIRENVFSKRSNGNVNVKGMNICLSVGETVCVELDFNDANNQDVLLDYFKINKEAIEKNLVATHSDEYKLKWDFRNKNKIQLINSNLSYTHEDKKNSKEIRDFFLDTIDGFYQTFKEPVKVLSEMNNDREKVLKYINNHSEDNNQMTSNYFIFANRPKGEYPGTIWDTESILKTKRYYFDLKVNGSTYKPQKGDVVIFKAFKDLEYWGEAIISSDAIKEEIDGVETVSFMLDDIIEWETPVRNSNEIYASLSNKDARSRIVSVKWSDYKIIQSYRYKYTWLKGHHALVEYLSKNRDQKELIKLLKDSGVDALSDKDNGNSIDLEEIDPFTFFCYLHKYGIAKRFDLFKSLNRSCGINIPKDFLGIPSANAMKVWLFPNKDERTNNEIERLWNLFDDVRSKHDLNESFNDALTIKNVGKAKLTEVLFYVSPERFLPIDSHTKPYLKSKGINTDFKNYEDYSSILDEVRDKIKLPFYEISHISGEGNQIDMSEDDVKENDTYIAHPLNQILYGAPGTGKTYSTVRKALAIIEGKKENDLEDDYGILKSRYDEYCKTGQIVFTTFHQSMCYEDFIEGIKPQTDEAGNLTYQVEDGVFKQLSKFAFSEGLDNIKKAEIVDDFSKAYDIYKEKVIEAAQKGTTLSALTKSGSTIEFCGISSTNRILVKAKEDIYTEKKERILLLNSTYPDIDNIKNISDSFISTLGKGCNASVNWALIKAIRNEMTTISHPEIKQAQYLKKYVLIIDEINRGNVSQIFGELITLLEENKRLGNNEQLQITLPYSKKKFGVPNNLHIIGTMNTADRSVEALDTALRRRFQFVEMPPLPKVIEKVNSSRELDGIDLVMLLETINERIEVLLDRDHCIGHSYFLKLDDLEALQIAFAKQIIPLLQEYFYGDYGKIALVLGEGFCSAKEQRDVSSLFAQVQNYDADAYAEKRIFELKNPMGMEEDTFKSAISTSLNISADSEK